MRTYRLGLSHQVPTEASIRTRLEKEADELTPLVNQANVEFLINRKVPITALSTGHIPLDIDVTPHDNSRTQKENVSRTYKGAWMVMPRLPATLDKKAGAFDMNCVRVSSTFYSDP